MTVKLLVTLEFPNELVISIIFPPNFKGKVIVLNALRHFDIYFKADNLLAYSPEMVYDKKQK